MNDRDLIRKFDALILGAARPAELAAPRELFERATHNLKLTGVVLHPPSYAGIPVKFI